MKATAAALFGAAMTLTLPAAAQTTGQAAWQPTRPVEFVVTSGAGGGTDLFARTVQSIVTRHNLVPTSIVVTNKGAGSGAEGYGMARPSLLLG
ncbi:hypothetical protein [Muricoccus vinaceus]|uniref:Tripartite tricarboxylate transporter family receptor n=1 Tax=Muricoccus vinaceus TaxID=424704 RepID=A0ABV6IU95_9PROT